MRSIALYTWLVIIVSAASFGPDVLASMSATAQTIHVERESPLRSELLKAAVPSLKEKPEARLNLSFDN